MCFWLYFLKIMADKVVTGIVVQKRNPERVSIYLDGEFAFGLSSIVAAWLNNGQKLTEAKIQELREKDGFEVAYQSALRLLNYRERTKKEISQKLFEKGYTSTQVEQVLDRLVNSGLVEDARFAQMWVENRNEFHPRSQRLMQLEMRQKGIDDEVIIRALGNSEDDLELATRAAKKQLRKYSHLEWQDFRQKLGAFLLRRGFSYGTVAPVVSSMWESLKNDPT
jgi:regulatory protein